jgi:hypothetical protein
MVFLQGELDRVLVLVDEGLGSFGLKDAQSDKGKGPICIVNSS